MTRRIQVPNSGGSLESATAKFRGLSQESQSAVVSIIERLALAEGVSDNVDNKPPIYNIEMWLTKLHSELKSEGTVRLYEYLVRRFFKSNQTPTLWRM